MIYRIYGLSNYSHAYVKDTITGCSLRKLGNSACTLKTVFVFSKIEAAEHKRFFVGSRNSPSKCFSEDTANCSNKI